MISTPRPGTARFHAAATIVMVLVVGAAGAWYPASEPPSRPAAAPGRPSITDARTHAAVVERVRLGEGYYDALGSELRRHNYPTRDPFNWRTPLHLSTLALAPATVWRAVLAALFVAFFVAVMVIVRRQPAAAPASVLVVGVLIVSAASDAIVIPEAWSGVLIGLSACAFAVDRRPAGVGLALGALFVRELAAPYCVVCTLRSVSERRWREVAAWMAGALAYAGYFAWHASQVFAHRLATDFAHDQSWLTLPGLPFLQATLLKLGWFALLPASFSSVALVLLVLGLFARDTPWHVRAASAAFAGFFSIAGLPFNGYWGFTAAPVWAIAGGYGAAAIAAAASQLIASSSAPAGPAPGGIRSSRC